MLHRLFGPFFSSSSPQFLYLCLWLPEPPRILWHNILLSKKTFFSIKVSARRVLCSSHTWLGWTWWIRQESTGGPATLAARYKFLKTRDLNKKTDWMCTFFLLRLGLEKKTRLVGSLTALRKWYEEAISADHLSQQIFIDLVSFCKKKK